jgi:hypothetical protein
VYVPNTALVGSAGAGRSAVLGNFADPGSLDDEVLQFVAGLAERNRIDFTGDDEPLAAPTRGRSAVGRGAKKAVPDKRVRLATHAVNKVKGERVLQRVRFACGPGCCGSDHE